MSRDVRTRGYVAVLKTPIPQDQCDGFDETLWEKGSALRTIDNGNMVYFDYSDLEEVYEQEGDEVYFFEIEGVSVKGRYKKDPQHIVDEAKKFGLEVDESTIRQFHGIYHNGVDHPIYFLTKDRYLQMLETKEMTGTAGSTRRRV